MGVVYAMDASTGKLIWKTPVGEHNATMTTRWTRWSTSSS